VIRPDPEKSRVILVGTSKYADERLPDLPAVARTIADLRAVLTHPDYRLVSPDHCTELVDEGDIRELGRRLTAAARQAEDLLLVFFAGHGLVGARRHDLYLGLPDSEWTGPEFNSLEYDKLRSAVLESRASTKIIILDCCFSGRVVTDTMADPVTEVVGQIEVDGTYVLASAQRDQAALIIQGEEHTAFAGRLLRLLSEGIPGGPELLTMDDLYRELSRQMKAEGLSEPVKRGIRHADLLPISLNRAFAAAAQPVLRERFGSAVTLGREGNWAEAATLLRDIAAEQARVLGPDHEDTLRSRQFQAHAVGGSGNPVEAAAMLRSLLAEHTRQLGADHADTTRTRQFLAVNLGEAGYRDEAVTILRVLLPDRRRLLGADDPDALRTAHMLARNLGAIGEIAEAMALLKEVIEVRQRVLGEDHAHTARARADLAGLRAPSHEDNDV
jgi:Caspase domain/Tetratricopeptide repeat